MVRLVLYLLSLVERLWSQLLCEWSCELALRDILQKHECYDHEYQYINSLRMMDTHQIKWTAVVITMNLSNTEINSKFICLH